MTVDAARRPRRRAAATTAGPESERTFAPTASIAIGEINQTVFDCPSCARPLALGARRCPGCRTRLINGVSLGKASPFVAAGLAVGLLVGAAGGLLFGMGRTAIAAPAPVTAAPNTPPLAGANGAATNPTAAAVSPSNPTATTAPSPTGAPAVPPLVRSSFVQVVATNGRLATAATGLRAALAARAFDASAVAQILRSVSADSVFGQQLAERVAAWSGSSAVGGQLAAFYGAIHETAANGLVASVQNQVAYRAASTAMIKVLGGMPMIEAAVRASTGSAGLELPVASGAPTEP